MQNKTVLVTGATNGMGRAAAEALAELGASIILVGRDEDKCQQSLQRVQRAGGGHHRYYVADLSVQTQVRDLADQIRQNHDRLDVLFNNAGAWFTERQESADGIEMTWALNHMAYFILTNELLDHLKHTAAQHGEARIINQASMAHKSGEMHWDDVEFVKDWETKGKGALGAGWAVYSQSKLANVIHTKALARTLEGTGVTANAVHPGVVVTGFSKNNGLLYRFAAPVRKLFNRKSPRDGAAPAIHLACSAEAQGVTGKYYGPPHTEEPPNPVVEDAQIQKRLWQASETTIR